MNKSSIYIRALNRIPGWLKSSIKNKITVSVLLVFIVVYAVTIGYVYNRIKSDIINGARKESLSTAQIIANSIYRNYEIPADSREIQSYIVGTKIFKNNIIELSLLSREMTIISSTNDDRQGEKLLSDIHRNVIENNTGFIRIIDRSNNPEIHIVYPVSAGTSKKNLARGCIDLSFSLKAQYLNISKIRNNILISGIIIFMAIFIVISQLSGTITRPIYNLYSGIKNMESDNNFQIDVNSSDEIGFLTKTFNDMVSSIKNSEKKIEDFSNVTVNLKSVIKHLEESINRERRFASNVAHELRTPISEIRTLVEVVLNYSEGLGKDDIENYNDILESARSMERIVSNLLILSRYDSNALISQVEEFNLDPVIYEILGRYSHIIQEKNITLKNMIETPFKIKSDMGMTRTILENLLSNAFEYSLNNSSVELKGAASGREFRLEFINRSFNIEENDIPRMFERFWRKDDARSSGSGHSGLGLPLARSLSDFLSYRLSARLRDGSTIVFTLTGPVGDEKKS